MTNEFFLISLIMPLGGLAIVGLGLFLFRSKPSQR